MFALFQLLGVFLVLIIGMLIVAPAWALCLESLRKRLVLGVFRVISRMLGLHVQTKGTLSDQRPLLLVSNHSSYIDIVSLGTVAPVSFTPKSDIRLWPVIGWCCTLAGCIYVERKPSKLPATRKRIHNGMSLGRVIALFPEGTTNDGQTLKPFKSGFFSLAEDEANLVIQPATIVYTHRNGVALTAAQRSEVAWYGDTALIPHLLDFLSWKRLDATVHFHEPVTLSAFPDRKALCQHCEKQVQLCLNAYR